MTIPKLPNTIFVLGVPFRVEVLPALMSEGVPVHGETMGQYHRIRISADQDIARQWQTLVHEYVHAVLHVVGAGNVLSGEIEEVVAQSLEYGMVLLLQEHGPSLLKAIGRKEK
jgi:hypothetical protein